MINMLTFDGLCISLTMEYWFNGTHSSVFSQNFYKVWDYAHGQSIEGSSIHR